ncbi:MAG TPA: prephenate dehydrogenase/arogenate dehydrogenase family protein [Steroidobacter sp.]|uniref:prephenate dehydrogenase/arogenate dehydrogenase family protein n=1 Tax=Steroidobacter sp. TaxID=1978227 RepID=UPI002ED978DD
MNLQELRERLTELDGQLLALIAERQRLSREVAEAKRAEGRGTRDYTREREVLLQARATAESLGVSPALAEQVLRLLIRGSLTTQERIRVAAGGRGDGKSALVIGGTGKMGRWFSDFMASQGYTVTVADPAGKPENAAYAYISDWRESPLDYDLIVVATPLKIANVVLQELAARKPRGVVFDIGSLKTPLRQGIEALQSAGVKVTSVHPMFGPDTELLSGRHVIFIDTGSKEAIDAAQELFSSTMAEQVVMGLDEHDRLIAYVLGLSHALNIAFFTALAESGEAAPRLAQLSSTTYDAQVDVATRVAAESPDLYFEIQHLNDYGRDSLLALRRAVEKLWQAVSTGDAPQFTAMMQRGREYLAGRIRND